MPLLPLPTLPLPLRGPAVRIGGGVSLRGKSSLSWEVEGSMSGAGGLVVFGCGGGGEGSVEWDEGGSGGSVDV